MVDMLGDVVGEGVVDGGTVAVTVVGSGLVTVIVVRSGLVAIVVVVTGSGITGGVDEAEAILVRVNTPEGPRSRIGVYYLSCSEIQGVIFIHCSRGTKSKIVARKRDGGILGK